MPADAQTDMEMHGWKPGKMEVNPGKKVEK